MAQRKLAIGVMIIVLVAGVAGVSASALVAGGTSSRSVGDLPQVVPVWQQVNSNGFGDPLASEVSALEAFNGYLYAGIHSDAHDARIYRSSDWVTWSPVIEPGFGISHDIAPRAILDFIVFHNRLYTSTGRGGDPGQIYRTLDGLNWAPMVIYGFNDQDNVDITAFAVYNGMIYAGVTNLLTGAQIWRSFTGDNNTWEQVAPETPGTAAASITAFAEFDGTLYAAIESEAPAQIWQSYGGAWGTWTPVVSDGFGNNNTLSTGGMAVFGGSLYVGAGNAVDGALLYRTNDGVTWEPVIPPGFGDANNQKVEMVFVFQNDLYVSVKNAVTGIELWRTTDGSLWERANVDGFGDSKNSGTNGSNATAVFLSHLYVGTANVADGGELWRMQLDEADLAVAKVDAVDPVVVGDPIAYTVTVDNGGPSPALNVRLTDNLPSGVVFVSATPDQGSCGEAGGTVTCNLGDLSSGASATVALVVTTTAPGTLTNHASATSDTVDFNPANNSASEDTTVNPAPGPEADLSITKVDGPDPVDASATLTYTLTITNAGPDTASGLTVIDELPAGVTYGGASGNGWSCGHVAGVVTCTLPSLAVGTAPPVVITVTAPVTSGTITNTVTVSGQEVDPDLGNNTASAVTQVRCVRCTFLPLVQR